MTTRSTPLTDAHLDSVINHARSVSEHLGYPDAPVQSIDQYAPVKEETVNDTRLVIAVRFSNMTIQRDHDVSYLVIFEATRTEDELTFKGGYTTGGDFCQLYNLLRSKGVRYDYYTNILNRKGQRCAAERAHGTLDLSQMVRYSTAKLEPISAAQLAQSGGIASRVAPTKRVTAAKKPAQRIATQNPAQVPSQQRPIMSPPPARSAVPSLTDLDRLILDSLYS